MNFESLSVWANAAMFARAAVVVWIAGTQLARYAGAIAEQTGIGREFLGILLLGGVTSLPELAWRLPRPFAVCRRSDRCGRSW